MDGKKITIVAVIAILVGLLIGYLYWGTQIKNLDAQLGDLRQQLAEAEKTVAREKELTGKVESLEAQLKQLADQLAAEKEKREKVQAQVSKGKK